MRFQAEFEQWVPAPLRRVFLFFSNPGNLPRIMPEWMQVTLEKVKIVPPPGMESPSSMVTDQNPVAGAGSVLEASYRVVPGVPFRIRSIAEITVFSMNEFFEDVQRKGPFRAWHHRHEFSVKEECGQPGTLIRDRVEYEIGFEPIGVLVQRWFIEPQMKRTFQYRQRAIEKLLG